MRMRISHWRGVPILFEVAEGDKGEAEYDPLAAKEVRCCGQQPDFLTLWGMRPPRASPQAKLGATNVIVFMTQTT